MPQSALDAQTHVAGEQLGLFGSARLLSQFLRDPISTSLRVFAERGPAVELRLGAKPSIHHIAGRDLVEPVLRNPVSFKSGGVTTNGPRGSAQRRLRKGILHSTGKEHAYYRKVLTPYFRRSVAEAARYKMAEIAIEELNRLPVGGPVNFREYTCRVSRRLSGLVLFGEDAGPLHSIGDLVERHIELGFNPLNWIAPLALPFSPYRKLLRCAEEVEDAILGCARGVHGENSDSNVLSALVNLPDETGKPVSDGRLAGQVANIFAAAYETTAGTLTSVCFCLAQSPELVARLAEEFATPDADESLDRAFASTLLDQAIWEATRLVTPVPYQRRKVARPETVCGVSFKPGDTVILSAFATNRDPSIYSDPDCFRPERWTGGTPNPFEWMVFSAGSRHCIGYWLAMVMLKVVVWSIVTNRRMTLTEGARIDLRVAITIRPVGGLPVEMKARTHKLRRARISGQLARLTRFEGPATVPI